MSVLFQDEVADFLGTLLSVDYVPPVRPSLVHTTDQPTKRTVLKTTERKRKAEQMLNNPDSIAPIPAKKGIHRNVCFELYIL